MATLRDLAARMTALRDSLPVRSNEARKFVARTVLDGLTEFSPVDTGRFVSNWRVGQVVGEEIPPYAEGAEGSTRQANVQAARAVGYANIAATRPGDPLVIFNSTSYGVYLNYGTSARAPLLFVERALFLADIALRGAKRLFND